MISIESIIEYEKLTQEGLDTTATDFALQWSINWEIRAAW